MSNANDFLSLYNKTDHHLKEKYKIDRNMSFSRMLDEVAVKSAYVRKYRETLKQFGQLRNAIVHEYRDGQVIAEPTKKALEEFQSIYNKISKPKRALDVVGTHIERISKSDSIREALDIMSKHNYSQIPVIGDDGFIGMFSPVHLIGVLSKSNTGSIDSVMNTRMDEVLTFNDRHRQVKFISKKATVHDAIEIYEQTALKDHQIDAILITETGQSHQMPIGIITDSDIPALLNEI